MNWIQRAFRSGAGGEAGLSRQTDREVQREISATQQNTVNTLTYALDATDRKLNVIEHSSRVALLAGWLGGRCSLSESEAYFLRTAAQLHELGMMAIPAELVERRAGLTEEELSLVRKQAQVSATLVGLAHHPRVAQLIRRQYHDHRSLVQEGVLSGRDLLLAGIFRVADVVVAVTWPRPYQEPLPWERIESFFHAGTGTRFHPAAVELFLEG